MIDIAVDIGIRVHGIIGAVAGEVAVAAVRNVGVDRVVGIVGGVVVARVGDVQRIVRIVDRVVIARVVDGNVGRIIRVIDVGVGIDVRVGGGRRRVVGAVAGEVAIAAVGHVNIRRIVRVVITGIGHVRIDRIVRIVVAAIG